VVLGNLAHAYTHPSILDVKLGTILYSPEATEEKRARMEKQARDSTTFETGLRLTGCQVSLLDMSTIAWMARYGIYMTDGLDMACPLAELYPHTQVIREDDIGRRAADRNDPLLPAAS
jgi:hypothetical protein